MSRLTNYFFIQVLQKLLDSFEDFFPDVIFGALIKLSLVSKQWKNEILPKLKMKKTVRAWRETDILKLIKLKIDVPIACTIVASDRAQLETFEQFGHLIREVVLPIHIVDDNLRKGLNKVNQRVEALKIEFAQSSKESGKDLNVTFPNLKMLTLEGVAPEMKEQFENIAKTQPFAHSVETLIISRSFQPLDLSHLSRFTRLDKVIFRGLELLPADVDSLLRSVRHIHIAPIRSQEIFEYILASMASNQRVETLDLSSTVPTISHNLVKMLNSNSTLKELKLNVRLNFSSQPRSENPIYNQTLESFDFQHPQFKETYQWKVESNLRYLPFNQGCNIMKLNNLLDYTRTFPKATNLTIRNYDTDESNENLVQFFNHINGIPSFTYLRFVVGADLRRAATPRVSPLSKCIETSRYLKSLYFSGIPVQYIISILRMNHPVISELECSNKYGDFDLSNIRAMEPFISSNTTLKTLRLYMKIGGSLNAFLPVITTIISSNNSLSTLSIPNQFQDDLRPETLTQFKSAIQKNSAIRRLTLTIDYHRKIQNYLSSMAIESNSLQEILGSGSYFEEKETNYND